MFERFQKAITPSVIVPTLAVTSIRVPADTTIESFVIWGVIDSDSVTFNVRVNGVQQFVGGARPAFAFGVSDHDEVTGLSIDVLLGDIVSLDVEELPIGGVRNIVFQTNFASGSDFLPTGGTTGQVLTKESNADFDANWEDSSGGGASPSPIYTPDIPYSTPSTEDDEFDQGTLDAKWTTWNVLPQLGFSLDSHLSVKRNAGSGQFQGIYQALAPAADREWIMKIRTPNAGNGLQVGFMVTNVTGYRYDFMVADGSSGASGTAYNETWLTDASIFLQNNLGSVPEIIDTVFYLKIKYIHSATTVQIAVSADGLIWRNVGAALNLSSSPLANVGIFGMTNSTSIPFYVDFFRRLQGNFLGGFITGGEGPQGDPGVVQSIVAGTNITVDNTDPANPVVASTSTGSVGCRVTKSANQSVVDSTWTTLTFNQEVTDDSAFHDNATNNTRLTVPSTGWYMISGTVRFAANGIGQRFTRIIKNGSASVHIGSQGGENPNNVFQTVMNCNTIYYATAGDYFELECYQSSGGNLNVENSADETHFDIALLG